MASSSSQKIRTPGVFKTQYSICPIPMSKTNMHQRSRFKIFLSKKPIDRGYKKAEIYDSISKTSGGNKEDLLTQNNEPKYRIPLTLTYNRILANVKEAVRKH